MKVETESEKWKLKFQVKKLQNRKISTQFSSCAKSISEQVKGREEELDIIYIQVLTYQLLRSENKTISSMSMV